MFIYVFSSLFSICLLADHLVPSPLVVAQTTGNPEMVPNLRALLVDLENISDLNLRLFCSDSINHIVE